MRIRPRFPKFRDTFTRDEHGGLLVIWAMVAVSMMMLIGVTFDLSRVFTTQSELQSYADSTALAAAAELDGRADAIQRARSAAETLVTDSQTFAMGAQDLGGADGQTLTFYAANATGAYVRDDALITEDPHRARFVEIALDDARVAPVMGRIGDAMAGKTLSPTSVGARAVAGFALEACDVAPVAVCLPTVEFSAAAGIGTTLDLDLHVGLDLSPGVARALRPVTDLLDGTSVCVGLLGDALTACLLAAREPDSACQPGGGLDIDVGLSIADITDSLNTRFNRFQGLASGFSGSDAFSAAPNVLAGLTSVAGLCLPQILPMTQSALGLPLDDCLSAGDCTVQGDGDWSAGRSAYVATHYDGVDPHPGAQTRFEFYKAEIEASLDAPDPAPIVSGPLLGVGTLVGGFLPKLCTPFDSVDPTRRLLVVAGINCLNLEAGVELAAPPVREYFEAFILGPVENGKLALEITACLGGGCGGGTLDTTVRDVVRLVE